MTPDDAALDRTGETLDRAETARRRTASNGAAAPHVKSVVDDGDPLAPSVRSFFEPRFGADFSDVRVHTGRKADEAARSIDARAFTYGNDVVFRSGQYDPHSRRGRKLLAHELTHVEQTNPSADRTDRGRPRSVSVQARTHEPTIHRDLWGAAWEMASQPFENLGKPGDSYLGIPNPLALAFDSVVTTSIAGASRIGIPDRWWGYVKQYCKAHPKDAPYLLSAMYRGPSFWKGGWILSLQSQAGAMTLDDDVFVDGKLTLRTFVHELYHVYQYNNLGKVAFLEAYYGTAAATIAKQWMSGQPVNSMSSSWLENEAYAIEKRFATWYNNSSNPKSASQTP